MKVENWPLDKIIPYARNPRNNEEAVAGVAASIKEFGPRQCIVVDKDGVIIAGHTRLKAAQRLGMAEFPVHVAEGLTKAQIKAYRLADNKVAEKATWDNDMLKVELEELSGMDFQMDGLGFNPAELDAMLEHQQETCEDGGDKDQVYTAKITAPIYTPKGDNPPISTLIDREKTDRLKADIAAAKLPADVARFLSDAAERHTVFHFGRIAEFYCHASPQVQDLMEKSGMVIIDFKKAIEYGFVHLSKQLGELADMEGEENEG